MMSVSFSFPPLFEKIQKLFPSSGMYLVGGAVRDAVLGLETRDLDFSMPAKSISMARKAADSLGGAFYILDEEREAARAIVYGADNQRYMLDFTTFQGAGIEEDLRSRDFTITAMAVPVDQPLRLIDPLGGISDLQNGVLRACTEQSLFDDPLRVLRAVRMAAQFEFRISQATKTLIADAKDHLRQVSPERRRDEFFRILEGPNRSAGLMALSVMDLLPHLLPGYAPLSSLQQRMMRYLEQLWNLLGEEHDPEAAASWAMGLAVLKLGRYREQIRKYRERTLVPERNLPSLVAFAALFVPSHVDDISMQSARQDARDGAARLRLSNEEIHRVDRMLDAFRTFRDYNQEGESPTPKAVYSYFQEFDEVGVDGIFIALGELLAHQGAATSLDFWPRLLSAARTHLEGWWEKYDEVISPPLLLDGHDLMQAFGLTPGPEIGEILSRLREAQALGRISSRGEALDYAASLGVGEQNPD